MHWQHVPLAAAAASTVWLLVQHFRGRKSTRTSQVGFGVPCFVYLLKSQRGMLHKYRCLIHILHMGLITLPHLSTEPPDPAAVQQQH
jgi:hypothetical protein